MRIQKRNVNGKENEQQRDDNMFQGQGQDSLLIWIS